MSQVTVTIITWSCNTDKVTEGSGTNNIIQHGNNILAR